MTEERVSGFEDSNESIQSEQQREKTLGEKKNRALENCGKI